MLPPVKYFIQRDTPHPGAGGPAEGAGVPGAAAAWERVAVRVGGPGRVDAEWGVEVAAGRFVDGEGRVGGGTHLGVLGRGPWPTVWVHTAKLVAAMPQAS